MVIEHVIQSCHFSVSSALVEKLHRNAHDVRSDIYGLVVLVRNRML